jgi:glycosyltransferase involved in cell wall biosynthesis
VSRRNKLLVVIPCFNEGATIRSLIQEIDGALRNLELATSVLVIDDGSTDNTRRQAETHATVVSLPVNLGIGGAVQTGIKFAKNNNFDFCIQIDGDGQHPPVEIPKLLAAYEKNPTNVTIGSRFLNNSSFRSTWSRRLGISGIRSLNGLLTSQRISDPTSGFRLFDRRAIAVFATEYPVDYPEPIALSLARKNDLTVSEIPITMRARRHGKSSISGLQNISYMVRVCVSMLLVKLRGTVK